ncbi:RND family efflux transporter, MFP subunit [Desulfosporosinus orientis DSM 765]|uniref:RND family efflux transporter, MFP subunit n=1 Tax=Desulfosporosinus orientis (strain ATCC 19365 / DSM 765 / NCIMB 8382 / VKM B-1628 / Singapore I) TaxID=768706 RepID=G7WFB9_DESOD|nr:efflux RND transporter periplasmic adaptor subunit [Desulfosporosinus orientis]AET68005.1 RND family efflux transporter, MFP subunit [Desulfosporosinus orientis DSM 765]
MSKGMINRLLAITLLSSTLALTVTGCAAKTASPGNPAPSAIPVKVMKVGSTTNDANLSGKIIVDQQAKVFSKVAGKVDAVNVKEGSLVKKGDLLIQLDSFDNANKVIQTQSSLETLKQTVVQTKIAVDYAQTNYERNKALAEAGALPQSDLDAIHTQLKTAEAAYEQANAGLPGAQASLDLAQSAVQDASIYSPLDGIITEKLINPGEMASPGVSMLTVVNMQEVLLQVSVPQDKVFQVKPGTPVEVFVDGIDQKFKGTIDFISPVSDSTNNTFPVKVRIDNSSGLLRVGMIARISLDSMNGKISELPKSSIVEQDQKYYVYKIDKDVARLVQVEVKEKNSNWDYVINGVANDDEIVINPGSQLTDGVKVQIN